MNFKNISHMYLDIKKKCLPLIFNAKCKLEIRKKINNYVPIVFFLIIFNETRKIKFLKLEIRNE